MSHILISTVETDAFLQDYGISLKFEKEFTELDFVGLGNLLEVLKTEGYLITCKDEYPLKPKGKGLYEIGKIYPKGRFINNLGGEFQSLVDSSNTWIASEWIATISVPVSYQSRQYSENEKVIKDTLLYKANTATSEDWNISQWDLI